jgi:hypothetical protein
VFLRLLGANWTKSATYECLKSKSQAGSSWWCSSTAAGRPAVPVCWMPHGSRDSTQSRSFSSRRAEDRHVRASNEWAKKTNDGKSIENTSHNISSSIQTSVATRKIQYSLDKKRVFVYLPRTKRERSKLTLAVIWIFVDKTFLALLSKTCRILIGILERNNEV